MSKKNTCLALCTAWQFKNQSVKQKNISFFSKFSKKAVKKGKKRAKNRNFSSYISVDSVKSKNKMLKKQNLRKKSYLTKIKTSRRNEYG